MLAGGHRWTFEIGVSDLPALGSVRREPQPLPSHRGHAPPSSVREDRGTHAACGAAKTPGLRRPCRQQALSHEQPIIPVLYVDLSEDEERLVLASLDPLAAMATTDEAKLRDLLTEELVEIQLIVPIAGAAEAPSGVIQQQNPTRETGQAVSSLGIRSGGHRVVLTAEAT
jgi:hypothetical protein